MTIEKLIELGKAGDIDEIFYDGAWWAVTGFSQESEKFYLELITVINGRNGEELEISAQDLVDSNNTKYYKLVEITM